MEDDERDEFDRVIAEMVFDGYSPDDIAKMARESAVATEEEFARITARPTQETHHD